MKITLPDKLKLITVPTHLFLVFFESNSYDNMNLTHSIKYLPPVVISSKDHAISIIQVFHVWQMSDSDFEKKTRYSMSK